MGFLALGSFALYAYLSGDYARWRQATHDFVLTILLPLVALALLMFLVNLWLTPYRLVVDKLREAIEGLGATARPPDKAQSEEEQFRDLAHQIGDVRLRCRDEQERFRGNGPDHVIRSVFLRRLHARISPLMVELSKLNIDCPPPPEKVGDLSNWIDFLKPILNCATKGDLERARMEAPQRAVAEGD